MCGYLSHKLRLDYAARLQAYATLQASARGLYALCPETLIVPFPALRQLREDREQFL